MKILFLSHEMSRTGAPRVLFLFVRWLRGNYPGDRLDLISLKGGPLAEEISPFLDSYQVWNPSSFLKRALSRLFSVFNVNLADFFDWVNVNRFKNRYDLVYCNSILTYELGAKISLSKPTRLILHLHEAATSIKVFCPRFNDLIAPHHEAIVVSEFVAEELKSNFQANFKIIHLVYAMTEIKKSAVSETENAKFIVGCSGTITRRKGDDLMIQTARYLKDHHPDLPVEFWWVGPITVSQRCVLEADLEKAGLKNSVKFLGPLDNPASIYAQFDVFFLPSREDPFPLVCIEVGLLGKPIILFEGATGTAEVVQDKGGRIVSYLNIEEASSAITDYFHNRDLIKRHGSYNKAAFQNFTPEIISPQLNSVVRELNTGN